MDEPIAPTRLERMNVEWMRIQRETGKVSLLLFRFRSRICVLVMTEAGGIAAIYDVPLPRLAPRWIRVFTELVQRTQTFFHPKRAVLEISTRRVVMLLLFERPVTFARPFRFGVVAISATPQVFVWSVSRSKVKRLAEFLVPKWFDSCCICGGNCSWQVTLLAAHRTRTSGAQGFDTTFGGCAGQACARRRTFRRWPRLRGRPRSTRRSRPARKPRPAAECPPSRTA